MTEIQGKSILVRVSARFELARVRVIGSRLYWRRLIWTLYKPDTCLRRIVRAGPEGIRLRESSLSKIIVRSCNSYPLERPPFRLSFGYKNTFYFSFLQDFPWASSFYTLFSRWWRHREQIKAVIQKLDEDKWVCTIKQIPFWTSVFKSFWTMTFLFCLSPRQRLPLGIPMKKIQYYKSKNRKHASLLLFPIVPRAPAF